MDLAKNSFVPSLHYIFLVGHWIYPADNTLWKAGLMELGRIIDCCIKGSFIVNTLQPRQTGSHFAGEIFQFVFNVNCCKLIKKKSAQFIPLVKVAILYVKKCYESGSLRNKQAIVGNNNHPGYSRPHVCVTLPWRVSIRGRDQMSLISQTTLSNAFSWMEVYELRLKFHWSLSLRVQLSILLHCFR